MCGPWGQLGGNLVAGGRLGRMVRADGFENWDGLAVGRLGASRAGGRGRAVRRR